MRLCPTPIQGLPFLRRALFVLCAPALAGVITTGGAAAQNSIPDARVPVGPLAQLVDQGTGPRRSLRPQSAVAPDPVVLLDRQRLYEGSELGKASLAILDELSRALIAENRQLEAELEEEERLLTQRRAQVSTQDFRALADDFDRRVQERRQAQDSKTRALARSRDEARQQFFSSVAPILGQLMQEIGAVAILDNSAVILSFERIDITDEAIEKLDEAYHAGTIAVTPPVADPLEAGDDGDAGDGEEPAAPAAPHPPAGAP